MLALGPFSAIARPIIERTLWIDRFDIDLGLAASGSSVGLSARAAVQLSMFGTTQTLGFDAATAFDPTRLATDIGNMVAAAVSGQIAGAVLAGFNAARSAAETAYRDTVAALATGASVVVNGVRTAASGVSTAATTVSSKTTDFIDYVGSALSIP